MMEKGSRKGLGEERKWVKEGGEETFKEDRVKERKKKWKRGEKGKGGGVKEKNEEAKEKEA